jgi:integrase
VSDITIGEHALNTLGTRLLRQSTLQSYLQSLRHLHLWDEPLDSVSLQMLYQRLLLVPNLNTRRKHTVVLRSVFKDLPGIRELRIPKPSPRIYHLPDEATLRFTLTFCPYELQALLMMYGGLRCGEACIIQPSDLRGNVLRVHRQRYEDGTVVQAKTVGEVVIPKWLAGRLNNMPKTACTPGAVRESLRRYGKKTGIDLSPHMLRHWYATMMVNRRINPEIARRQMRHADLKTTLGYYAQVSKADIDQVVEDLFDS